MQEDAYLMTTDGRESLLTGAAATNLQRLSLPEKVGRTLTGKTRALPAG